MRSIQLIPAADGFDSVSAQKDVMHLPAIQAETGVPNSQMLFFDDEHPNIRKVGARKKLALAWHSTVQHRFRGAAPPPLLSSKYSRSRTAAWARRLAGSLPHNTMLPPP